MGRGGMAVYCSSVLILERVSASTGRPSSENRLVASNPKTVVYRGVTIDVAVPPRAMV